MNQIKRIISLCLILCICSSGVQVNADNRYTEQSLEIESVSGTETYKVLNVDNRIYMSASDFGKITRYEYKEGSDNILYTLGDKFLSVSKNEGKLSLPMQNYSTKCSKAVSYNGSTYIAMDELLPWLNVECSVENNKLVVTSDAISMWELTDVLTNNFETYKFNLYKDLGETNASSVGLVAAMMFDTILNVRFDRLIPGGDSIFNSEGSLYDRECYRDLYIEMATDDTLASSQAEKAIKKVFEINGNIGTIEEAFGVDAEEISKYGDSYLAEFGIDEELSNKLDFLTDDWLEVRNALKGAAKVSKYFNPFKILKSYETALHTTNEYRNYLKDITYDSKQNSVMQTAIREASLRLDESKGAVISAFIDLGHELVVGKTEDTFEKIIKTAFEGKTLGSIFLYLDLAKIFYSTIVPVADGMSEMSKFIIYSNVSDYSWDKAYEYAGKELTQDNIAFMCQSYMASLKSSKKAFEGMQTLFDSKAFGLSMFGNNDGLMDHRIEPTEEMLAQLALTSSCRENDSTENKDVKAKEIRELLNKIQYDSSANVDNENSYENEYNGIWYGYGTVSTEAVISAITLEFLSDTKLEFGNEIFILIDEYTAESEMDYEDGSGNKNSKMLLEFGTDSNGELALASYMIGKANRRQMSETMCYYRSKTQGNFQDFRKLGDSRGSSSGKLSEEAAQAALKEWLGDLGTWVAGEDNVLVCDGIYNCNGKEYYQFRLRGWVFDHATTLTWYVISVDGTEMFEGQCSNGYLNRF